jgi:hypothetical protein
MTKTFTIETAHTPDGETLVLVEGNDPLPGFPTIQRHLPELQGLIVRAYRPGGAAGSTAPFSDMWVLGAA